MVSFGVRGVRLGRDRRFAYNCSESAVSGDSAARTAPFHFSGVRQWLGQRICRI